MLPTLQKSASQDIRDVKITLDGHNLTDYNISKHIYDPESVSYILGSE